MPPTVARPGCGGSRGSHCPLPPSPACSASSVIPACTPQVRAAGSASRGGAGRGSEAPSGAGRGGSGGGGRPGGEGFAGFHPGGWIEDTPHRLHHRQVVLVEDVADVLPLLQADAVLAGDRPPGVGAEL